MSEVKGETVVSVMQNKDSTEVISSEYVSTYEGADLDGFLNPWYMDGRKVPSSYRLYHSNASSVALMKAIGSKAQLKKKNAGLMFINDMSRAPKSVNLTDTLSSRGFETKDGVTATFSDEQAEGIQAYMAETFAKYQHMKRSQTTAELKRIKFFGEVIGYMNLWLFQVVDDKTTILVRCPGSKALRSGRTEDVRTLANGGGLLNADGELLGERVLVGYNWHDSTKNTHINRKGGDWGKLVTV